FIIFCVHPPLPGRVRDGKRARNKLPQTHSQPRKGMAMSTPTELRSDSSTGRSQTPSASTSAAPAGRSSRRADDKAWVAKPPKQPVMLEGVDLGPLGSEDVEVAVEHCGLCHSDLSVLNNEWGISQYPVILGHEVIGRVTAIGPNAKGLQVGQRVGVGWNS